MSSYLTQLPLQNFTPQLQHSTVYQPLSSPDPAFQIGGDCSYYTDEAIVSNAIALLQEQSRHCMNTQYYTAQPDIRVGTSTPTPLPTNSNRRQDSVVSATAPAYTNWQFQTSMSLPTASTHRPLKRARTHQRTPSASTVASNGPASPYTSNTSYPHIANTDFSPHSPAAQAAYADQALFSKNLPTPQQTPTDSTFLNSVYIPAHLAMKTWAIDHHTDDLPPEYYQSSRHSMSSHGNDSPATPQSGAGDYDAKHNMNQNDYKQPNPSVQLYRTESQAYQDELYTPQTTYTSTPAATKRNSDYLTPHRNLISERLQTANIARSASPTSAISRERSPFRDGSPLAPTGDWQMTGQAVGTAAGMRQQQKADAEQAEYAQHQPQLHREPTKSVSPKDVLLDYNPEANEPSLFQDNIPAGYRQHSGGAESWQNGFVGQPGSSFGNLVATGPVPQLAPWRSASADHGFQEANFGYMGGLPQNHHEQTPQVQSTSFQPNSYVASGMGYPDPNPDFPAHLTSMESSVSEGGPPPSSQESYNNISAPQRPTDTRANTGTYTCTYHGCAQRFESHIHLQRHKRDVHRSQQKESTSTDTNTGTTSSPRSSESPIADTDGMTSAALQARNSQAGPHKCARINPSTNKPCNTIFSRPYDLTRHEDTIHNNRKMKVRCPMCREEKTFSRNDALTRHMRVVHPEVESFGKRTRRD